jgi:hypothetical protein
MEIIPATETIKLFFMPDIFDLFKHWWKQILAVIIASLLVVGVISYLKPKLYLSVATAVPASSFASDKSKIFNENIQALYAALGTPDDLDMIVGTAKLDTVYLAVTDEFNLFDHYKMKEKGQAARNKAASLLKKNSKVMKSEYGELKVKTWNTDKNLAPQLANAIMEKLKAIHQDLQNAGNMATLQGLVSRKEKLQQMADSAMNSAENNNQRREQISQYEKLIGEYQLMVDTKPPVLITVEKAKAAAWPDQPKTIQLLGATAVLAFIFSLLAALMLERKKTTVQ